MPTATLALHKTKIDLAEKIRTAVISILNQQLADGFDLYSQTKHAHWNVKGPHFIALHELFDKIAGELPEFIDELAERITTLGGTANGTTRMSASASKLPEYPAELTDGADHLRALIDRWAAYAGTTRAAINKTDDAGDKTTADLFTQISGTIDKNLWFLEAHVQSKH